MAATALRVPLAAPPCPGCAGGGEVNGVVCRECGGSKRALPRRRSLSWKRLLDRAATPAGVVVGTVLGWSRTVPGVGGAAAVSYGVAVTVHGVFHQVPALGVAAAVGGMFLLLIDSNVP